MVGVEGAMVGELGELGVVTVNCFSVHLGKYD